MNTDEDPNEEFIARTLAKAGMRPRAPRAIEAEIEAAVASSWHAAGAAHRYRRTRRRLIAACTAAAAILAGLTGVRHWTAREAGPAGIFIASRGEVQIDSPGQSSLAGGQMLAADAHIRTGTDGRLLLAIANMSLRVGANSTLRLHDRANLELQRGQVYLDSNSRGGTEVVPFSIETRFGRVEHIGTQYQVAVSDDRMITSVREGKARVILASGTRDIALREQLIVRSDGTQVLESIPTFGTAWDWSSDLMPDFPIEGRTLAEFFAWFTRESGISIGYADANTAVLARQTSMSGSIAGLSPLQALQGVLTATRFEYRVRDGGRYLIELRPGPRDKLSSDGAEPPVASFRQN